ncbi:glycosyltransferase family 2 protein [Myxococcota bacterium]|nr:glycosyltransferase family 2 protein [Myxococcota bacterium]
MNPCVLIPSFEAAATLGAVINKAADLGPIFVIDDGSTDETARVAESHGVVTLRHPRNLGKGAALLTGLAAAAGGFSHAITLDADGQHAPQDAAALLAVAAARPEAIIIGARDFNTPHVPGASRFGRWFSNLWVWIETGARLSDTQSGFRIYPVAQTRALRVAPSRFEWEVAVLVWARWAKLPIIDVPIPVHYPPPDQRVSHYRGFIDSARISWLHTRLVTRGLLSLLWPPLRRRR